MVSRTCLVLPVLLLGMGCASSARRAYYVPLGLAVQPRIQFCRTYDDAWSFEWRCQGVYQDRVLGRTQHTLHLQLDVARPASRVLLLPLDQILVSVTGPHGTRRLPPPEAFRGLQPVSGEQRIEAWELRSFDLFLDLGAPDLPAPDLVRVRWRHRAESGDWVPHECSFQRIPAEHPKAPVDRPPTDRRFGYRDGWYMPGLGNLGPRQPIDDGEVRSHHVFHSP